MATCRLLALGALIAVLALPPAVGAQAAEPPRFGYCMWHRRDVEHAEEILAALKGTPCDTIFVCPMIQLDSWRGTKFSPSPRAWGAQPEDIEPLIRRARELGFTVAIQPNWTIDASVEKEMLPTHNPWWPMFAHTTEETWRAWTKVLEHYAVIAERAGAEYLLLLHETDCLLPYPGWADFIPNTLRKRAPSVKLVYSQHGMQHLRLFYEPILELGLAGFALAKTNGDRPLAAAKIFEMVGQRSCLPDLRLPADPARQRQLGYDLYMNWVKRQSPEDRQAGRYPCLDLVRTHFDAYKSSDYWPLVYRGKTHETMAQLYRSVTFNPLPDVPQLDDVYYVDFVAAMQNTRKIFGAEKPWFTETGLEPPLPKDESRAALCARFVRATREALTGATDCIVWWGNGNDRDFIAVMQDLAQERRKAEKTK
ncbi:MAG: hypothetical protein AB1696_28195 [Planctomycetota bacterium]